MARSRNIKPGFFLNEDLGQIDPLGRLLFAGLWTICDREGRLEDRPKRVKVTLLPYDECDPNDLLDQLQMGGFIIRYENDNNKYIQILNFLKHQRPHVKETKSTIPEPTKHQLSTNLGDNEHTTNPPESLNPHTESLNPLSRSNDQVNDQNNDKPKKKTSVRFDEFWNQYPKKVKKKSVLEKWKTKNLDKIADTLISDVITRKQKDRRWIEGYVPDPTTYINQERWTDEIELIKPKPGSFEETIQNLNCADNENFLEHGNE